MTAKLTANESLVLLAIRRSEYQDGENPIGNHVWTDYINPFESRRTFSGVVASLVKKGLVTVYRGTTNVNGQDPSTIALTAEGVAALTTPAIAA